MHETEIHSYPNLRTCTLGIVTQRGAAHDAIAGATQVLLQTITRGTKNHNEVDIAKLIDGTGGSLFSTTEKDFAIVGAQVQPKFALRTLDLLRDFISYPTLEKKHFEIEKEKLLQIYQQIQSNSIKRMMLFDADRAVFGEDHPLGRPQIGTPESLAQITLETLHKTREELLIRPWGFAVGKISKNLRTQLTEKFNDHYSSFSLHNGQRVSFPSREVPPNNIITSVAKEDANAYLCINIVTKSDPNIIGLTRFSSALMGESYGSRMFTILRDQKAFGYIVGSTLKLISDEIILRYYMETKPSRAEEALDTLTEIIVDIGKEEISKQEYNTTRDFLLGQLDLSFDDSRGIAARIINRATHGLVPNVEMGYEEIQRVSSEDILTTWKTLLSPNNFSLAIVGNIEPENIEKKWKNKTFSNQEK